MIRDAGENIKSGADGGVLFNRAKEMKENMQDNANLVSVLRPKTPFNRRLDRKKMVLPNPEPTKQKEQGSKENDQKKTSLMQ